MARIETVSPVTSMEHERRRRVLLFRIATQGYALPVSALSEIVPMAQLVKTPSTPQLIAGLLQLGGRAIPVLRLARLFGLEEQSPSLYTPLLVLRRENPPLALLVDCVSGIVNIEEAALVPLREGFCFNDCATGLLSHNGEHMVLLDDRRLLSEQEERCAVELAAIEQFRLAEMGAAPP